MKLLTDPSGGSYAAVTRSRNTFGQYERSRGPANATASAYRTTSKGRMAAAVAAWQALTPAQRQAWYDHDLKTPRKVRLGITTPIGGMQSFCSWWLALAPNPVPAPNHLPLEEGLTLTVPPFYDAINDQVAWQMTLSGPCFVAIRTTGVERVTIERPPGRGKWWVQMGVGDLTGVGPYPATIGMGLFRAQLATRFGSAPTSGEWTWVAVRTVPGPWQLLGRAEWP